MFLCDGYLNYLSYISDLSIKNNVKYHPNEYEVSKV